MKKYFFKLHLVAFFVFLLSFTINQSATAGWEWQNPLPQGNTIYDIWGSSDNDIFAVGYNGFILHYDGLTWSAMESGTTTWLYGVWGNSRNNVFAVGDDGTILHYEGNTCSVERIYGGYSEETELLRNFRDNIPSKNPEGQELIKLYYEWSPVIVKVMEEDEELKEEVKEMIDGILPLITKEVE